MILRTLSLTFVVEKTQRKQNDKFHDKHPNMLLMLTLTWCHCTPADLPTRVSTNIGSAISAEVELDDVALAGDVGQQGGADTLASNLNVAIRGGATALLHQGCPVTVRDCQVVRATDVGVIVIVIVLLILGFNVKCSEL